MDTKDKDRFQPFLDLSSLIWELSLNETMEFQNATFHLELIDSSKNYSFKNKVGTKSKPIYYEITPINFEDINEYTDSNLKLFFFDILYNKLVEYTKEFSFSTSQLLAIYHKSITENINCEFKLFDGKNFKWKYPFYIFCTFDSSVINVWLQFENTKENIVALKPLKLIPFFIFNKAKIKNDLLTITSNSNCGISISYNLELGSTQINMLNPKEFPLYFHKSSIPFLIK